MALRGTNSYSGYTYVANGTLNVLSDANLGTGPVILAGNSTLQFGGPTTLAHSVQVLAGTTSIDTNGSDVTLAGPITAFVNGFAFQKLGAGTLSLTSANPSLSLGLNASVGAIAISGNGTIPQVANIAVASGAEFRVDNTNTNLPDRLADLARVTIPSGGTFRFVGNAAPSTETFGGINLTTAGAANVTVDGTTATLTASGVVTGVGTLTKAGTGTLVLSPQYAASNFTGGLAINGGTVRTGNASALAFGGTLPINATPGFSSVASGGTLDLGRPDHHGAGDARGRVSGQLLGHGRHADQRGSRAPASPPAASATLRPTPSRPPAGAAPQPRLSWA